MFVIFSRSKYLWSHSGLHVYVLFLRKINKMCSLGQTVIPKLSRYIDFLDSRYYTVSMGLDCMAIRITHVLSTWLVQNILHVTPRITDKRCTVMMALLRYVITPS